MQVTAVATRSGGWWAIEVPEIPGLFTQVKRLHQVAAMAADAAATLGHDDVDVTVSAALSEEQERAIQAARAWRGRMRDAEASASAANRAAGAALKELPLRDAAELLGVSPQRISALRQ